MCLIPESAHGTNAASAVLAGLRVVVVECGQDGAIDLGDLRAKLDSPRRRGGRHHADLPVDQRGLRGDDHRGVRRGAHRGRPGVRRRGEPERAGRAGPAGQVRRRRVAPEPAQDVLHPARRRRPGGGAGRGARAPGRVPARQPGRRAGRRPPRSGPPGSCRSRGRTSR